MALFNPGAGTATVSANSTSIAIAGCDISALTAGMTINFGSRNRKAGDSYIINTVAFNGSNGGTITTLDGIPGGWTNAPFVVDVLAGQAPTNGTYSSFVLARILTRLQDFLGIGTNLDAASKDVALDRATGGTGTFTRLKATIAGVLKFGLEQRTVAGLELWSFRAYPDGTTPIDALVMRNDTGAVVFKSMSVDIASGATTDLAAVNARKVNITGTTTIASFGAGAHDERLIRFAGTLTLTHNATTLILPGNANITTAAGDLAYATSDASGNWTLRHYQRANGAALATPNATTLPAVTAFGVNAALGNRLDGSNVAIGSGAMQGVTTGTFNVAVGQSALTSLTTGIYEVAVGTGALQSTTTGQQNTAIGAICLSANTTGNFNVALGYGALQVNSTGGSNVAVGTSALAASTTAGANVAVGFSAGGATTVGGQNVAVGHNALGSNTTGSSNTAVGYNALVANAAFSNTTGLGMNAAVTASNQVQLGDAATTTYAYGAVQNRSDARDKADVRDTVLGLDFVCALRPVDFRWDLRDLYRPPAPVFDEPTPVPPLAPFVAPDGLDDDDVAEMRAVYNTAAADDERINGPARRAHDAARVKHAAALEAWNEAAKLANIESDGSRKRVRFHHGLIAQEVRDVLRAQNVDFGGLQDHSIAGGDDVLSLGYEEMIGPLIKAVQQLAHRVAALEANAA